MNDSDEREDKSDFPPYLSCGAPVSNRTETPAANSSRTTRTYQHCPPPARWHKDRLVILRMVLSLGPNVLFTAHAVSGGERAGAPAGTGRKTAALSEATRSQGAALAAGVQQRRDVAHEDVLVMLVTKAVDLEGAAAHGGGSGYGAGNGSRAQGRGTLLMDGYKVEETMSSSGETKLGDYIVNVFVDVLLMAGFQSGRKLPVVAKRSPRRSRCCCAQRRAHTVSKAMSAGNGRRVQNAPGRSEPETREVAVAGRGVITEKIAVSLPRPEGTHGEQGGSKVESKRAGCLRTSAEGWEGRKSEKKWHL
ncbi:hypothetical protein C8J57DRAFT_1247500 [Mycena rebaudengoi]|nr:hypothetical protein C8J57DRAFT_1247500 [Mycena rebaudengoi]